MAAWSSRMGRLGEVPLSVSPKYSVFDVPMPAHRDTDHHYTVRITRVIRAKPTSAERTSMPALTPLENPCLALGCVLWFDIVPVPLVLAGFSINEDQMPCPAPVSIAGFSLSQ
jgi:hypothetical protein